MSKISITLLMFKALRIHGVIYYVVSNIEIVIAQI